MENISKNHKSLRNDRYNTETPQEIRQYEEDKRLDEEEQETFSGADFTEVYNNGREYLKKRGYDFRPTPGGAYCDHEIYKKASIKEHHEQGYTPDNKLEVWIPIDAEDFRKVKDAIIDFIDQSSSPKTSGKFWNVVYSPTPERRKPIYELAKRELMLENQKALKEGGYKTGISLTATTYNPDYATRKWIPQLEWFDERIKQVELKDLLSILPPAEREIFALCIGRALVGEDGSMTTDLVNIRHTFRTMAILVGRDAGLGKSTLIEYMTDAMKECGYMVANLQKSSARFGWGKIIASDLAYNDDLTPKTQKQVITSDHIKSIISSGEITVEDKGVDGKVQKARCVMLANSNDYAKNDFYKMDSGMKSRIKLLATYSGLSLSNMVPEQTGVSQGTYSLSTEEHWNYIVNKLETSHRVLALWLLRLCADKFLASIGLELTKNKKPVAHPLYTGDNKLVVTDIEYKYVNTDEDGRDINNLYIDIVKHSVNLRIQVDRNCTKDFVYFWRYCWAICDVYNSIPNRRKLRKLSEQDKKLYIEEKRMYRPDVKDFQNLINSMSNGINTFTMDADLKALLRKDREEFGNPGEFHIYDFFDNLLMDSVCFNSAYSQLQRDKANMVNVPDIFKNTLHHFVSKDGFRLSGSLTQITDMWNQARDMDDSFIDTHDRLCDNAYYNSLRTIVNSVYGVADD